MTGNVCYKVGVTPEDFGKKDEMIGVRVSGFVKNKLEQIMTEEDRTMSYVANALLVRGLFLYEQDGLLKETKLARVRNEGEITDELQKSPANETTPQRSRASKKAAK